MLGLMRQPVATWAPSGARFFRSSAVLQGKDSVNARRRKKVKVTVLPPGHIKPWIWKRQLAEKRGEELKVQFDAIKDVPVVHWKPPVLQAWVTNMKNQPVSLIDLNRKVWGEVIRKDVVHRVVRYQRAKWRQGTHKTKTRDEVRGGGAKPRAQKGSGRARLGSIRSPLMRGGGNVHGPRPRTHKFLLPKKVIKMGLRAVLSAKFAEGNVYVIKDSNLPTHKTARLLHLLKEHWRPLLHNNVAIVHGKGELDNNMALAARTIWNLEFYAAKNVNVYDLTKKHCLMVTETGLRELEEYLLPKNKINFLVDMPIVKLAEVKHLRVMKLKRKQKIAYRMYHDKKKRIALLERFPSKAKIARPQVNWSSSMSFKEYNKETRTPITFDKAAE